jgi:hypothetical protein
MGMCSYLTDDKERRDGPKSRQPFVDVLKVGAPDYFTILPSRRPIPYVCTHVLWQHAIPGLLPSRALLICLPQIHLYNGGYCENYNNSQCDADM